MLTHLRAARARARTDQDGFSLVEVLVAISMIAIMMVVLAGALTMTAQIQTDLGRSRAANNVLQQEVELAMSAIWDDVMMRPNGAVRAGPPDLCAIGSKGFRVSAQSIKPTSTFLVDSTPIFVTRKVTWFSDGTEVSCANAPNDRSDLKVLTLTVQWASQNPGDEAQPCPSGQTNAGNRCRTTTVYLSRNRTPTKEVVSVPTVPGAPLDVTATFVKSGVTSANAPLGNSYVTVTWAPPNVTGNATLIAYRITAYKDGVEVETQNPVEVPHTKLTYDWPVTAGPLTPSTTYTFKVQAINLVGIGALSLGEDVTTPAVVP